MEGLEGRQVGRRRGQHAGLAEALALLHVLGALAVDLLRADLYDLVDHPVGVVDRDQHVEVVGVRVLHPRRQGALELGLAERVPVHVVAHGLDPEREEARVLEHVGLVVADADLRVVGRGRSQQRRRREQQGGAGERSGEQSSELGHGLFRPSGAREVAWMSAASSVDCSRRRHGGLHKFFATDAQRRLRRLNLRISST